MRHLKSFKHFFAPALLLTIGVARSAAQCTSAQTVVITVTDETGAALPATLRIGTSPEISTDASGKLLLPCVPAAGVDVELRADGFEPKAMHVVRPANNALNVVMTIATVQTTVDVHGDTDASAKGALGDSLDADQLKGLASDPDEFQRQLLALASTGTSPSAVTISLDGFQESTTLPPKDAIVSVKANADPFSAELGYPIVGGGRLDITTKPGSSNVHGSAFFNSSARAFNASDPYSVAATPAGNQSEGASMSGPLPLLKSGYSLSLQHRSIREQNVVNALGLSSSLTPVPLLSTIPAPTALWLGDARVGWQVRSNDMITISFAANTNDGQNQGVGGLTLPEAGYDSHFGEFTLRAGNDQTSGSSLLHQTRIGLTWRTTSQAPLSSAPSLTVSGFFTGGGSTQGALLQRDKVLEFDDTVEWTRGRYDVKGGTQVLSRFFDDRVPNVFNGAYVFGGGAAPALDASGAPTGQQTTIAALEQYRRALAGIQGGNPTTYQITTGSPETSFAQYQQAFFLQAGVQLPHQISLQLGLRYQLETEPRAFLRFGPRAGIAWAPTAHSALLSGWIFRQNTGLFVSPVSYRYARDISLLDGVHNQQATVYSPQFVNPTALVPGAIAVMARRMFDSNVHPDTFLQTETSVERSFGKHWSASAGLIAGQDWGRMYIRNINAPIIGTLSGPANATAALLAPRPLTADENIFSYQSTAHLIGVLPEFRVSANGYKYGSFQLRYTGMHVRGEGNQLATAPQDSYSKNGESSRPDFEVENSFFFTGSLKLPFAIQASAQFDYSTGLPFNITTGTDANGDGSFNDRPSYAAAGAIVTDGSNGVYRTLYGVMTTGATNGTVPRNLGTMPSIEHLSLSLQRDIAWKRHAKQDGRLLTLSARSSNAFNHTDVTAVDTIVGSPAFNQGVAAEPARRLELGARFSF